MKLYAIFLMALFSMAAAQASEVADLNSFNLTEYKETFREVPRAKAHDILRRYNNRFRPLILNDEENLDRNELNSEEAPEKTYIGIQGFDLKNGTVGKVEYPESHASPETDPRLHNPDGVISAPAYRYMKSDGVLMIAECVNPQGYGAWDKNLPMNENRSSCRGILRLFIKL